MEGNEISIHDIVDACLDFINDAENEEKLKALEDIKSKMVIKDYMPLQQKELLLRKALIDIRTVDDEPYHFATATEIALSFDVLLAYVINLNLYEITATYKDYDFYDIFSICGIFDYIKQYAGRDYDACVKMFDRTVSFDNIKELLSELSVTMPENIDALTNEFKRFRMETDPDLLKNLNNIAGFNDSLTKSVKEGIEENARKVAKEIKKNNNSENGDET